MPTMCQQSWSRLTNSTNVLSAVNVQKFVMRTGQSGGPLCVFSGTIVVTQHLCVFKFFGNMVFYMRIIETECGPASVCFNSYKQREFPVWGDREAALSQLGCRCRVIRNPKRGVYTASLSGVWFVFVDTACSLVRQ